MRSKLEVVVDGTFVDCVKGLHRQAWEFSLSCGGLLWRVMVQRNLAVDAPTFYCYATLACESCELALPDGQGHVRTVSADNACSCAEPVVNGVKNRLRKRGTYSLVLGDAVSGSDRVSYATSVIGAQVNERVHLFLRRRGVDSYAEMVLWNDLSARVTDVFLADGQPWRVSTYVVAE